MILTRAAFATITQFVLREGDRQTYCNKYNHNPHLSVRGFDVFLNPEGGQQNINCDPGQGGFDEIVVRDEHQGATKQVAVRLVDEALEYDAGDRPALEFYFGVLVAHISSQP